MANEEQLELLRQRGVDKWNQWREENSGVQLDLIGANLIRVYLRGVDLCGADLRGADLRIADLGYADLRGTDLREADLSYADLRGADLRGANLRGTHLSRAYLRETDLREANLRGTHLRGANLCGANLGRTQVLGTNFENAILTGACIQDWNTNSAMNLKNVVCEHVYLNLEEGNFFAASYKERRPYSGSFQPGEFTALFQQAVDTVDLIFKDGIDWQAFFQSFQNLRSQYADQDLSIQAIEKKRGGAFIVRLEVAEDADKTAIESSAKELYETQLKTLEAWYERQLRLQGEQHSAEIQRLIAVERQEKATLMGVLTTMASNQGPKYDLSSAQFAGGFAETVAGDQVGGTINNNAAETPSLAEAAAEIQNLLKQLEASNPTATEADQTAFLNVMIPPTRRERFVGALKEASGAALEEVPYGAVLKALVEGWQKPNG